MTHKTACIFLIPTAWTLKNVISKSKPNQDQPLPPLLVRPWESALPYRCPCFSGTVWVLPSIDQKAFAWDVHWCPSYGSAGITRITRITRITVGSQNLLWPAGPWADNQAVECLYVNLWHHSAEDWPLDSSASVRSKHRNSLFTLHRDTLAVQVAANMLKHVPKSWATSATCTDKFEIAGELQMALDAVSPASREVLPAGDQGDVCFLMLSDAFWLNSKLKSSAFFLKIRYVYCSWNLAGTSWFQLFSVIGLLQFARPTSSYSSFGKCPGQMCKMLVERL